MSRRLLGIALLCAGLSCSSRKLPPIGVRADEHGASGLRPRALQGRDEGALGGSRQPSTGSAGAEQKGLSEPEDDGPVGAGGVVASIASAELEPEGPPLDVGSMQATELLDMAPNDPIREAPTPAWLEELEETGSIARIGVPAPQPLVGVMDPLLLPDTDVWEWASAGAFSSVATDWQGARSPRGDMLIAALGSRACMLTLSVVLDSALGGGSTLRASSYGACEASEPESRGDPPPAEGVVATDGGLGQPQQINIIPTGGEPTPWISNSGRGALAWLEFEDRYFVWMGGTNEPPYEYFIKPSEFERVAIAVSGDDLMMGVVPQLWSALSEASSLQFTAFVGAKAISDPVDVGASVAVVLEYADASRQIAQWDGAVWNDDLALPDALSGTEVLSFRASSDGARLLVGYDAAADLLTLAYYDLLLGWVTAQTEVVGAPVSLSTALGRYGAVVGYAYQGEVVILSNAPASACAFSPDNKFTARPRLKQADFSIEGGVAPGTVVVGISGYHPVAVWSDSQSTQVLRLGSDFVDRTLEPLPAGMVVEVAGSLRELVIALAIPAEQGTTTAFWKTTLPAPLAPCAK